MTEPYYSDEHVTLYHGNCLKVLEWLEADVLITDPPYGRAWKQGDTATARGWSNDSHPGIANDESTDARDAALAMWGSRPAISFGDLTLAPPTGTKLTAVHFKDIGAPGMRGAIAGVRRDAEAIYFIGPWPSGLGGRSSIFNAGCLIQTVNGIVARNGGHPHTKSGKVMQELVQLCPPGTIADPFAGSGSTLVAAKALGRRAIGVELEERYCEIAARRLSQGVLPLGGESS